MKKLIVLLLALPILLAAAPSGLIAEEKGPVAATLVVEESGVEPGRPFWVAIRLDAEPGWHTYWKNPGESGFATSIDWDLPQGFQVGEAQWPTPSRFEEESRISFGYEGEVVLLTLIHPPADLAIGDQIDLRAEVNWLACRDACLPGFASISQSISVVEQAGQTAWKESFTRWRALLPHKLSEVKFSLDGERLLLDLPEGVGKVVKSAYFFPEGESVDYRAAQELDPSRFTLRLLGKGELTHLKGLLVVDGGSYAIHASLAPVAKTTLSAFTLALLFAFLGGVILNLMPCVLPVISLKVMGFVEMAGRGRREGIRHGLAFTFGVLASFWLLASLLLALRSYGEGVGWGFQLQEPVFVAILIGVIFLLGLSLFGLFELGTSLISLGSVPSKRKGVMGSFLTGILATAVATPCTGPMLGPALGYAVTLPAVQALAIFSSIAIGLSFPYLILAAVPEWLRFLPKPGKWMVTFKQLMGFMMMATLLWLLWVFSAEVGSPIFLIGLLGSLLLLSVGGWIYGRWGTPLRTKKVRYAVRFLSLLILCLAFTTAIQSARAGQAFSRSHLTLAEEEGGWLTWDPALVDELRAAGKPVFIDFTAKWCLTCQVNKAALHSTEVVEAFGRLGVVAMEADWTKRDPAITKHLAHLGRSGVPVYVYYSGNPNDEPIVLPQMLTTSSILKVIEQQR